MANRFKRMMRDMQSMGILDEKHADNLMQRSVRFQMDPLDLLMEEGRIEEGDFRSLRSRYAPSQVGPIDLLPGDDTSVPDDSRTLDSEETQDNKESALNQDPENHPVLGFPVPGWERYRPIALLGKGGMGEVYKAFDNQLQRQVALKFVRSTSKNMARMFVKEARAQAKVDHKRVCKVYEVGQVEDRTYIAMQFIDGLPFHRAAAHLPLEKIVLAVQQAADGIQAAHAQGLIHRDIKPANIMVEEDENGGIQAFVMDFGLARNTNDASTTLDGTMLGTPHYMSPEQAKGKHRELDRRSDVYSLGATLYRVLSGHPPVSGETPLEIIGNVEMEEPELLSSQDPSFPKDLEAIVFKCLEKEPTRRYGSARKLSEDLGRFLSGDPVKAHRAGFWYRWAKRARKHKLIFALSSVFAVLLFTAAGWGLYQRHLAELREDLAREFTRQVDNLEADVRFVHMVPLQDTRSSIAAAEEKLELIRKKMDAGGTLAKGPGLDALGRGAFSLRKFEQAREALESAWQTGFRQPETAYALALSYGALYRDALSQANLLVDKDDDYSHKKFLEQAKRNFQQPALQWFRQVGDSQMGNSNYAQALLAFYNERLEAALAHADAALERQPWRYEALKLKGDVYLAQATEANQRGEGDLAEAAFEAGAQAFAQAAEIGRSDPYVLQSWAELNYARAVTGIYSDGTVLPYLESGLQQVHKLLVLNPQNHKALMLKARFLMREAEFGTGKVEVTPILEEALTVAKQATGLKPEDSDTWLTEARIFRQLETITVENDRKEVYLQKGAEALEQVAEDQRDARFYNSLGLIHKSWGDMEARLGGKAIDHWKISEKAFKDAKELDQENPSFALNQAMMIFKIGDKRGGAEGRRLMEEAAEVYQEAQQVDPNHIYPPVYLGRIYLNLGKELLNTEKDPEPYYQKAIIGFKRALEIRPSKVDAHNGLGHVFMNLAKSSWHRGQDPSSHTTEAFSAYKKAGELATKSPFTLQNRAKVALNATHFALREQRELSQHVEGALDYFDRAVKLRSNIGLFFVDRAQLHTFHGIDTHNQKPLEAVALAKAALVAAQERMTTANFEIKVLDTYIPVLQAVFEQDSNLERIFATAHETLVALFQDHVFQEHQDGFYHFADYALRRAQYCHNTGKALEPWLPEALDVLDRILEVYPKDGITLVYKAALLQHLADMKDPQWQQKAAQSTQVFQEAQRLNANLKPWIETLIQQQ